MEKGRQGSAEYVAAKILGRSGRKILNEESEKVISLEFELQVLRYEKKLFSFNSVILSFRLDGCLPSCQFAWFTGKPEQLGVFEISLHGIWQIG